MHISKVVICSALPLLVSLVSLQVEATSLISDLPLAQPLVLDTNFSELGGSEENRVIPGDTYIGFGLSFTEFGQSDPQLGLTSATFTDPARFVKISFQHPHNVVLLEIGGDHPLVVEAALNGFPVASITTDGGGIGSRRFYGFSGETFDEIRFYHSNGASLSFEERAFALYRLQLSEGPVNFSTNSASSVRVPALPGLAFGVLFFAVCIASIKKIK